MLAIRIISLSDPRNEDLKTLNSFCADFEVIEAVNASTLSENEVCLQNRFPNFSKSEKLSLGEYACSMSHAKALESFINGDPEVSHCLIFEDDALISGNYEDAISKVNSLMKTHQESCTIVHCGGMEGMKFFNYFKLRNYVTSKPITKFEAKFLYRASSYLVNRKSAKAFLAFLREMPPVIADDWFDLVCSSPINIHTASIFAHPIELENSSLEAHRHGS